MTSHYAYEPMTTLHDVRSVLGQPLDTFFWALTISWSRPWLMCEVALSILSKSRIEAHTLRLLNIEG
jgi:hypothetical protein